MPKIKDRVTVIAEIGKNYIDTEQEDSVKNNLMKAEVLILNAKESGADVVKFQCHVFEDEKKKRSEDRYQWIIRNEEATPYDRFWVPLKEVCDSHRIELLITPMSKMAAEKVNNLVKRWKVGSADIVDFELLEYLASTKKPIIISSGMSTNKEVEDALEFLAKKYPTSHNQKISLMHCVSMYPCSEWNLNLNTILYWKKKYPKLKIGFSDHSLSTLAPAIAVTLGAEIIEKHFTVTFKAFGPDHKTSLVTQKFMEMVDNIRAAESMMGVKGKILQLGEKVYLDKFRV